MALKHCNNELKVVFDDKIQQWPLKEILDCPAGIIKVFLKVFPEFESENAPIAIAEASQSYRNVASLWQL